MRRVLGLCGLLTIAFAARGQGPAADWQTITTPHFRVHYPAPYEAWAARAASRVESIRDAVTAEIGFTPDEVIDVIVSNPIADPNGVAWPILRSPRVVFYTDAPDPEEQIGAYSDWIDLLAVHEVAHVIHMSRPSRNPTRRFIEQYVLPISPITLEAPRWVLEGYATVIEGRLTGAGRPPGTMRALILRKWAAAGNMPTYDELDGDGRFLGMSMAYLAGSAYLEWLEQRSGAGSLRNLWRRMTARQQRSFDEAFTGVFGDSPDRLYGVFVAELTASAMAIHRATPDHDGDLWMETARASGDPSVSYDGTQLAMVQRERDEPPRLVVYDTSANDEEQRKYDKRIKEMLERDPEDVAPLRTSPLPRDEFNSYRAPDGGDITTPRWLRDGSAILFAHRQPDAEGYLHHDLFLWEPETGYSERLTHLADVRDADPFPDGRSAVAVRSRYGMTQLVRVDLGTGAITAITEPGFNPVAHPRLNVDGTKIAYIRHQSGAWSIVTREVASGTERVIPGYTWPEWDRKSPNDLFATWSSRGFAEVHHIAGDGSVRWLTRSTGGAFQPAPAPDGRVFFMSLEPDGFVVRVIDGANEAPAVADIDLAFVPAVAPLAARTEPFTLGRIAAGEPYGIGRQEWSTVSGVNAAVDETAIELGLRFGDILGRLSTLVIGSFGRENGQDGLAVASVWRGWPVEVAAHVFHAEDQRETREGIEVRGGWERYTPLTALRIEAGGLAGDVDLGFAAAGLALERLVGSWSADAFLAAAAETGSFDHARGSIDVEVSRGNMRFGMGYQYDVAKEGDFVEVGGLPSSIVPDSAFAKRIFDPALAAGTLRGERYNGFRAEAQLPVIPLTGFYQKHRTDLDDASLAGVTLSLSSDPFPILRVPGLDATLGAAMRVDDSEDDDIQWWIGMRWRP